MEDKTNKELIIRLQSIVKDYENGREILSKLEDEYNVIVEELKKRLDK